MVELTPVRPRRLSPGDTVAVVSPSWGGPSAFPHVFDHGLAVLRGWGLEIREYPSTRAPADELRRDPALRARDVNLAFADPGVRALITSIGGDDSIRLLSLLDADVIAANPKILLGFSDSVTLLAFVRRLGIVTFHGPSVMAGLAQLAALPPACGSHVHEMLFEPAATCRYPAFGQVSHGYPSWREPAPVGRILRSFGALGVFDSIVGILVGRPRDHDGDEAAAFEAAVIGVVAGEFGRADLPVVANLPFGHTDPPWVLPLGVRATLDVETQALTLAEPWLA